MLSVKRVDLSPTATDLRKRRGSPVPSTTMSMSKKCGACKKTIYPNDPKLSMGDHTYHKSCSKCEVCGGQLNIKNFATSGGRLVRSFLSLVSGLLSGVCGGVVVVQFDGRPIVSFPVLRGRWVVGVGVC